MKKLLFGVILLTLIAAGCAVTDYPVITDDRGSFSGVIRTGHKAYIIPSGQAATTWTDGSDELFSLVYQNQYGDQKIYTFDNFDPTASVLFMDQTYCDWRYDGCEITRAWNPANPVMDSIFDYELFLDCAGARSLSLLVSYTSRIGECGDAMFMANKQAVYGEFANLATTSWRGGTAYVLPINGTNTSITLNAQQMPIYGQINGFVTDKLQLVIPMTPNTRHELRWLSSFAAENGKRATASITYNSMSAVVDLALSPDGINYNLARY